MIIKKIILTIVISFVSVFAFSATSIVNFNTDNVPVHEFESAENVEYWTSILNTISKAQNTGTNKLIIKYDGKWKYVVPTSEAIIQLDIILSHLTSGTKVNDGSFTSAMKKAFEIAKKDKIVITIR